MTFPRDSKSRRTGQYVSPSLIGTTDGDSSHAPSWPMAWLVVLGGS
jgi:hypothetical protein